MASASDPKARAREAFSDLDTPQKTAFVIEATFSTIGAALRETGERLGDIIRDFDPDAFFHMPEDEAAPEAEPKAKTTRKTTAKKTASKTSTTRKTTAKKSTAKKSSSTKTAGRSRKKKSDDDA
ncbi:MAG: hypothetical protein AAFQ43_10030 [Bacteroidota bacterium]